jgi:hypothetical protein
MQRCQAVVGGYRDSDATTRSGTMSAPRRQSLGPSGVTEAIAARYREILPPGFVVETNGPILNVKTPTGGSVFFGNFILRFPFLPAKYRLERFAHVAFGNLPEQIAHAASIFPDVEWPAIGTTCHVRVSIDEVHIWYGHTDNEDEAVLKVRPIPRTELGL